MSNTLYKPYKKEIIIWKNQPAKITKHRIGHKVKDIVIYTDGWKLQLGTTGSSYVVYKNNKKNKDIAIASKKVQQS